MRTYPFNDLEGLRIAIEMERRGGEHYRRALNVVKDPEIVALLQRLERDEAIHAKQFTDLYKAALDRNSADSCEMYDAEANALLSAIASDIVFPSGLVSLVGNLSGVSDILRHGIKSEEDSIKFYEAITTQARNAQTRETFGIIIEQEREHLKELTALLSQFEA